MKNYNLNNITVASVNIDGECSEFDIPDLKISPVVYILYDNDRIYVGETVAINERFKVHNRDNIKGMLNDRLIIHSKYFNKSVIKHLEAFLIQYFSADGPRKIVNVNLNSGGHVYYQKHLYEKLFPKLWPKLIESKIANNELFDLNNSDIFKYSPYKSLTSEQQSAVNSIFKSFLGGSSTMIVHGGGGTGKTVLASYLMKLIATPEANYADVDFDDPLTAETYRLLIEFKRTFNITSVDDIALVVPMSSIRVTLKQVFSNIHGLSAKNVISPTDISKKRYRLVLVDESHRLKRRKNIPNYKSFDNANARLGLDKYDGTELDWILKQSDYQIFFYDELQSIKPSDIGHRKFSSIKDMRDFSELTLKSQIRSKGGEAYADFVNNLLTVNTDSLKPFEAKDFDLFLYDDFKAFVKNTKSKDKKNGLSRMVAGYSWKWVSKRNKSRYDICIDKVSLRWNSTNIDFIHSPNAVNEVGCIHTTQGYDINYVGVIFGKDIGFNTQTRQIEIDKDNYKDRNGKYDTTDPELYRYIINIYRTLLLRGISGVYIYCCDKGLREYFRQYIKTA